MRINYFLENGNVEQNLVSENSEKIKEIDKKSENSIEKKKSKKRQLEENDNNDQPSIKKKVDIVNENTPQEENVTENGDSKFSWKNTILEIVTSKGEISMKKLKKKVIAQYLANFPDAATEKAASKFEKKLGKVSDILISEDKVRLATA